MGSVECVGGGGCDLAGEWEGGKGEMGGNGGSGENGGKGGMGKGKGF